MISLIHSDIKSKDLKKFVYQEFDIEPTVLITSTKNEQIILKLLIL